MRGRQQRRARAIFFAILSTFSRSRIHFLILFQMGRLRFLKHGPIITRHFRSLRRAVQTVSRVDLTFRFRRVTHLFRRLIRHRVSFIPHSHGDVRFVHRAKFTRLRVKQVTNSSVSKVQFSRTNRIIRVHIRGKGLLLRLVRLSYPTNRVRWPILRFRPSSQVLNLSYRRGQSYPIPNAGVSCLYQLRTQRFHRVDRRRHVRQGERRN